MHRMYYPVFLHNVLLIKTLIYYILFNIDYFMNSGIIFIIIKFKGIFNRQNNKININKKRLYSSQQKFTNDYKKKYVKENIYNNDKLSEKIKIYRKSYFDNLNKHPLTFNTIKQGEDFIRIEVVNSTTKEKEIEIKVDEKDINKKGEIVEVVKVGENSYTGFQGMPKIVYVFEVNKKELGKGEVIEEDKDFFNEEEKEILVNKQSEIINSEEIKEMNVNR